MTPAASPQKLREQYPDAWIPVEEGDQLKGTLHDVTKAWSDARARGNGGDGNYPILIVEIETGQLINFHAFQTVAMKQVAEKRPIPGEKIVITYKGEGKAKNGMNAPKLFHINVEGRDPAVTAERMYDSLFGRDEPIKRAAAAVESGDAEDVSWLNGEPDATVN